MQTKYKYKEKTYTNIYPLSEALGQEGILFLSPSPKKHFASWVLK